jgi:hypothetical protein
MMSSLTLGTIRTRPAIFSGAFSLFLWFVSS